MSRYFGPIVQHCYVVPDIDAAMDYWINQLGVGPFYIARSIVVESTVLRGKPGPTHMNVAFGQSGGLQIELIQPTGGESLYQEFIDEGHVGSHHIGHLSPDLDAGMKKAEELGFKLLLTGHLGEVRFVYYEGKDPTGPALIELMGACPDLLGLQKMIADASVGWTGEDPIREIAM